MEIYKNLGKRSNVAAFEITEDSITIEFKAGNYRFYLYDKIRPGLAHVNTMKLLAISGRGLNSFISTKLRSPVSYARKW